MNDVYEFSKIEDIDYGKTYGRPAWELHATIYVMSVALLFFAFTVWWLL